MNTLRDEEARYRMRYGQHPRCETIRRMKPDCFKPAVAKAKVPDDPNPAWHVKVCKECAELLKVKYPSTIFEPLDDKP